MSTSGIPSAPPVEQKAPERAQMKVAPSTASPYSSYLNADNSDDDLFESEDDHLPSPVSEQSVAPVPYNESSTPAVPERKEPTFYTNDARYVQRKARNRKDYTQGPAGIECEVTEETPAAAAPEEQYFFRVEPTLAMRVASTITSAATAINKAIFRPSAVGTTGTSTTAPVRSDELRVQDLASDYGCPTIRAAIKKKLPATAIEACLVDPARFESENISVDEMQKAGWTIMDAQLRFGLQWGRLCNLGMRSTNLTRENKWFHPATLANYVAREEADLVRDIGFGYDDICRLRCSDLEMSQLGYTFETLLSDFQLTKLQFLSLPWYLQTMSDVLLMEKTHLIDTLELQPADFSFLYWNRGWTPELLKAHLGFTDAELAFYMRDVEPLRTPPTRSAPRNTRFGSEGIVYDRRPAPPALDQPEQVSEQNSFFHSLYTPELDAFLQEEAEAYTKRKALENVKFV